MTRILLRAGIIVMALGVLALLTSVPGARAAGIVVTSTADNTTPDGRCTLREALTNANNNAATYADCQAGSGADTISFASNVTGTITLGSALPSVADTLSISGPGAGSLAISGHHSVRVFYITPNTTAAISGLTIRDGYRFNDLGGGIYNAGVLTVNASIFSGNTAHSGAGIFNDGTATVRNSTFSGNYAHDRGGGGIANNGTLTVSNSTFAHNTGGVYGGGIYNMGTLTVSNSTFSGNRARWGGGIETTSWPVAVTGTLFSSNEVSDNGAAIYFSGIFNTPRSVSTSCFVDNRDISIGAALDVGREADAPVTVDNNWWNTPTGPNTDGETTNVPVVSFLTSPPACGAEAGGGDTVDLCADGRLNCRLGDDYAIVYNAQDEHGHSSLHTYCVDAGGNGILGMIVTPHDLESIPSKPTTNTLVKKGDAKVCRAPISFWALTTGEYQVNIGPDYKGDLIRIIFDGLPPAGTYFKKCNVLLSPKACSQ